MASLTELLTDSALQRLAFGRSYDRGRRYFEHGMVKSLSEFGGKLVARVRGAELYEVGLWAEEGLAHECTCPVGADGLFCKHCVAAGLEWLERQADGEPVDDEDMPVRPGYVTRDELREHLRGLDRKTLADMLMRQAEHDPEFAERLTTRAALSRPGGPGKKFLRKAITDATRPHGGLYGRATTAFAERIRNALEPVWAMAGSDRGAEALELAEHALNRVIKAMGQADDSNDGRMRNLLREVQELHREACRAARPEPRALARELFNTAVNSDWEVFLHAAETHAEVLGKQGLAEYRRLAEKAWQQLPALKPGQENDDGPHRRFTLTAMMEALARTSGDIEELVAVMARDLSCEYRFLEIAHVYKDAGQDDRALEWAEKGLAAFPQRTDSRLRKFLFEEYLTRGRPNEAMNLAWAEFTDSPYEHKFQELRKSAERIGQWPTWREEAVEFLRERAAGERRDKKQEEWGWGHQPHVQALVEVLLAQGEPDRAWQEAQGAQLPAEVWLRLAQAREKTHPADAVVVYRRHAERLMTGATGKRYEQVVRYLLRVGRLMTTLGQAEQFGRYLAGFRAQHKRKWSLMRLLDSAKWP